MKRIAYVLFFIVAAIAVLGALGAVTLPLLQVFPGPAEPKANTTFIILNQSDAFTGISFDDVASRIPVTLLNMEDRIGSTANATLGIRLIQGYDLDAAGNAGSWNILVWHPAQTMLVTYSRHGERMYNWSGKCPEQEINLTQIITPGDLFRKNQDWIIRQPESITGESRDLTLAGNTYYLTITGPGTQRDLRFNATTGALISTND
jgi:hypothetical protein